MEDWRTDGKVQRAALSANATRAEAGAVPQQRRVPMNAGPLPMWHDLAAASLAARLRERALEMARDDDCEDVWRTLERAASYERYLLEGEVDGGAELSRRVDEMLGRVAGALDRLESEMDRRTDRATVRVTGGRVWDSRTGETVASVNAAESGAERFVTIAEEAPAGLSPPEGERPWLDPKTSEPEVGARVEVRHRHPLRGDTVLRGEFRRGLGGGPGYVAVDGDPGWALSWLSIQIHGWRPEAELDPQAPLGWTPADSPVSPGDGRTVQVILKGRPRAARLGVYRAGWGEKRERVGFADGEPEALWADVEVWRYPPAMASEPAGDGPGGGIPDRAA